MRSFVRSLLLLAPLQAGLAQAAAITVSNTLDDTATGNGCSLREAVSNANTDTGSHPDCAAGDGTDTITFDGALLVGNSVTIPLSSELLLDDADLTIIDGDINGDEIGGVIVSGDTNGDGQGDVRVLGTTAGSNSELRHVTLTKGFTNSTAGAGIQNLGTLTLLHCAVLQNKTPSLAVLNGGGIFNQGTLDITACDISDNVAGYWGGGIHNEGVLSVQDSTFARNFSLHGAGISNAGGQSLISRSTISGSVLGGAIYVGNGSVTIEDSTLGFNRGISNNPTEGASGIRQVGGTATLLRSVLVPGDSTPNCTTFSGSIINAGGNLQQGDSSCQGIPVGNANLGPLQDNGGLTFTHLPGLDSALIDAVDCPPSPGMDQRGVQRPQGPRCDIGAVEVQNDSVFVDGFEDQ